MKRKRLTLFWSMIVLMLAGLPSCDSVKQIIYGTPTPTLTPTPTYTPTPTSSPTVTPTPTSTPDFAATQQYDEFYSSLEKYYLDGHIPTKDGMYVSLGNDQVESASGHYEWKLFDPIATNFLLQATVNVKTESRDGGCGFIFHVSSSTMNISHKVVYFGNDSYTNYFAMAGFLSTVDTKYGLAEGVDPSDPAGIRLTLIVYEKDVKLIIEDQLELFTDIAPVTKATGVGLVSVSGDRDKGTSCSFKNIILWTFPD